MGGAYRPGVTGACAARATSALAIAATPGHIHAPMITHVGAEIICLCAMWGGVRTDTTPAHRCGLLR